MESLGRDLELSSNHGDYVNEDMNSTPRVAPNARPLHYKEVSIGDNVWLGENVCVLQGVRIGNGCIIGANSVVTKDIPDNSIAVGAPAKVIKRYDSIQNKWLTLRC